MYKTVVTVCYWPQCCRLNYYSGKAIPAFIAEASVASCERDDRPSYTLAYLEAIDALTSHQKLGYEVILTILPTILPTKMQSIAKSSLNQPKHL